MNKTDIVTRFRANVIEAIYINNTPKIAFVLKIEIFAHKSDDYSKGVKHLKKRFKQSKKALKIEIKTLRIL